MNVHTRSVGGSLTEYPERCKNDQPSNVSIIFATKQ